MHRQKVVVFSDSTLRLGRVGHADPTRHWIAHWNANQGQIHTEKFNIFGEEIEWQFEVKVAATSLDLVAAIKHDVEWYGKGI